MFTLLFVFTFNGQKSYNENCVPLTEKPNQLICASKICEKYLWESDIFSKDVGQWLASSLKMLLIHTFHTFF